MANDDLVVLLTRALSDNADIGISSSYHNSFDDDDDDDEEENNSSISSQE